jgi:hypothetical protein
VFAYRHVVVVRLEPLLNAQATHAPLACTKIVVQTRILYFACFENRLCFRDRVGTRPPMWGRSPVVNP